ncbi:MAG: hypothetical protein ABSF45_18345 [Terriglobia bacterium]|jgi:tetratricopeptide (TPR) repeat protein
MKEISEGMTCLNCHKSGLPDYALFCLYCGSPASTAKLITGGASAASHPPGGDTEDGTIVSRTDGRITASGIFVGILGCVTVLAAIAIFSQAGPWNRYIALVPFPRDLGQQAVVLHDKLEEYERSADTLKTLVSFMVGLSTLYGLALALGAYLGVQEATNRAQQSVESLDKLQKKAESDYARVLKTAESDYAKVLMDIRREFPLYREMQNRIGNIRTELQLLIPESGFGEGEFRKINDADFKVKIAHYERTVGSFEFFNLDPFRDDASKIYQLLGSFHSHKWLIEKKLEKEIEKATGNNKETGIKADPADVHWARFYLGRSYDLKKKDLNKDDVATLNEMGDFEVRVTSEWNLARDHLTRSLGLDSKQQRPRYFLSIVEHFTGDTERGKGNAQAAQSHYAESVRLLTAAFEMNRWQQEDQAGRSRSADFLKRTVCYMHYNRACARARLAELETDPTRQSKLREDAVEDLKSAFPSGAVPKGVEETAENFKEDTKGEGDLATLVQSQYGTEVKQLLELVSKT